jgi:ATP-dependent Clp protease ATP-binding subunit ClpA
VGSELLLHAETSVAEESLIQVLREHFRPEFVNRLDQVVPFYPLLSEDIRNVLRLEINAIRKRLEEKNIGIRMYQRAYEFIAEAGYSREYGARELRRAVDRLVTTPISDGLIDGRFENGDMIDILIEDGQLVYRKGKPAQSISRIGR